MKLKHFLNIVLLFLLVTEVCHAQDAVALGDTLNGKVKKFLIKNQRLNAPDLTKDALFLDYYKTYPEETAAEFRYDQKGNNVFERAAGMEFDKIYNEKSELVEKQIYIIKSKVPRQLVAKQTFKYERGKPTSTKSFNYEDGKECLNQEDLSTYDKNMNLTERSVNIYKCGVFRGKNGHKGQYSPDGLLIKEKYYSRFGNDTTSYSYTYGKDQKPIEVVVRAQSGKVQSQQIISYDKEAHTKTIKTLIGNKTDELKILTFDQKKRLIDQKRFITDMTNPYLHETYVYDGDKLMVKTYEEKKAGYYKMVYKYDAHGNATEYTLLDRKEIPRRKVAIEIEYE